MRHCPWKQTTTPTVEGIRTLLGIRNKPLKARVKISTYSSFDCADSVCVQQADRALNNNGGTIAPGILEPEAWQIGKAWIKVHPRFRKIKDSISWGSVCAIIRRLTVRGSAEVLPIANDFFYLAHQSSVEGP